MSGVPDDGLGRRGTVPVLLACVVAILPTATAEGDPTGERGSWCPSSVADTARVMVAMDGLAREPMEATDRAPGGEGTLELSFAPSPYGLALATDGRPRYHVGVAASGLRPSPDRRLVVWAATPELDRVRRLGSLGEEGRLRGAEVSWSRFLVFVTAEPDGPEAGTAETDGADGAMSWEGPILLVGRAPSSRMHTMRGHGIFEAHGIGC